MLIVQALGLFTYFHQAGRGAHAPAFAQLIDAILRFGLWELRGEQGAPAPLGQCFPADAAAPQSNGLMAVDGADAKIALARMTKALACRIDTGESVEVGALPGVLLQNS